MKDIMEIELCKLKNSKIVGIALLAPIFMVIQGVTNLLRYYDLFTGKGQNVWLQLYSQSMIFYVSILLPVLISVIMTLLARIENAHNGWKFYFSLPVDKEKVYIVKFALGCAVVFLNILAFIASLLIAGKLIGLTGEVPYDIIIAKPLSAYIAALPLMGILFVLSIKFSQMAIPLGIGIGLSVPAIVVANSKYWMIYPWTYPIMAALGGDFEIFNKGSSVFINAFVLWAISFIYGYIEFINSDVK